MQIKAAVCAMLLLGGGCSHAQKKTDLNQAQALRGPPPAAKPMAAPPSQGDEVATNDDSRAGNSGDAIYFDFDSYLLRNDAQPELQKVAQEAKQAKSVRIEGNCDERGTTEYNLALGDARARAAATYLQQLGVRKHKITTISYGSAEQQVPEGPFVVCDEHTRAPMKGLISALRCLLYGATLRVPLVHGAPPPPATASNMPAPRRRRPRFCDRK